MDLNIKCVVVGDGAVGKTCMLVSYAANTFNDDYVPTVFDNYNANVKYGDLTISLGLWDTAGQEVNPNSYDNVQSKWVPEVRQYCPESPLVLCGTKLDLRDDAETVKRLKEKEQSPITKEMGESLRQKINATAYVECSGLTKDGLSETFDKCIESVVKKQNPEETSGKEKKKSKGKSSGKSKACLIA